MTSKVRVSNLKDLRQKITESGDDDILLELSDFSNNDLEQAADDIIKLVKKNQLVSIVMDKSIQRDSQAVEMLEKFFDSLQKNTSLNKLCLFGVVMSDKGVEKLSQVLGKDSRIRTVDIRDSQIGPKQLGILVSGLEKNKSVRNLFLDGNKLGDKGASHISGLFKANNTIEIVGLEKNGISAEGAKDLVSGLSKGKNTSIKELQLKDNNLSDEGVKIFADFLKGNPKCLQMLDIRDVGMGDVGLNDIIEMLKVNSSLRSLFIGLDTGLREPHKSARKYLKEGLSNNVTLQKHIFRYGRSLRHLSYMMGLTVESNAFLHREFPILQGENLKEVRDKLVLFLEKEGFYSYSIDEEAVFDQKEKEAYKKTLEYVTDLVKPLLEENMPIVGNKPP